MVCDTFLLSQKHTGSSFKASMITANLSCMYIYSYSNLKIKFLSSKMLLQILVICKSLSTYRQEDAHEFLRYLIESMERCYLSVLGQFTKTYVTHYI